MIGAVYQRTHKPGISQSQFIKWSLKKTEARFLSTEIKCERGKSREMLWRCGSVQMRFVAVGQACRAHSGSPWEWWK